MSATPFDSSAPLRFVAEGLCGAQIDIAEFTVEGEAALVGHQWIAQMRKANGEDKSHERRLVGIASIAGIRGLPGAEAYSASKAAVISYLESLRVELRNAGVQVLTICPGYIRTPMTAANPFPMPFLMPADEAARRFARAIERGGSYTVIPWQMGLVTKVLRLLPNALYDRLFAAAPRKPRQAP